MPIATVTPLGPQKLRRTFNPKNVPFETSDQIPDCLEPVVGQKRAKAALSFGLAMKDMDYHVFVDGPRRTGKTHLVRTFVENLAKRLPPPPDWVYVHNFQEPDQPRALPLPTGGGRVFAQEMESLVEGLKTNIPALFESEEYAKAKEAAANQFKQQRSEIFAELDSLARKNGYVLRFDPTGIMLAPADEDGQPLPESRIREMSEEERAELRRKSDLIQAKITESLRLASSLENELNKRLKKQDRDMVLASMGRLFDDMFAKYAAQPKILAYLNEVREDVVEHFERFQKKEAPQTPFKMPAEESSFNQYKINVFVDNSESQGAPVVEEGNPTFPNLFGRIERQAQFGALITDFTLLKAGALHKANGGFLVIPVLELLRQWLPWEGLKRAIRERKAFMEDVMEQLGYMVTRSLRPEPIPLDFKVILVGSTQLYQLLHAHDPQFPKLFKIRAQMSERMHWAKEEVEELTHYLCTLARDHKLYPLHRTAVARLLELAAETAGDRERLTLKLAMVEDVVKESNHFARQAGRELIMAEDVVAAIDNRRYRSSIVEERLREAVTRGFINVETEGRKAGQINGLAVLDQGDLAFGMASRITASLGLGKRGVVAIDRESKLSGPFHTKGVLILAGFLHDRFAKNGPLALTANLVFEQSYSRIDGDSASLAELLCLLSRLADVPLRQDLAVTGSVSQQGQVQAIGGVNQKVEGFFRLCQARGLTGTQGVVIPRANIPNLMLHPDVVKAARRKKFQVYAVETVEEALELFTGLRAGTPRKDGSYPQRSVYFKAARELQRLRELASKGAKKKTRARKTRKKS